MSLNTLFELHMKSKILGEILAKPDPKKEKNYHHWNTSSGNKRLWKIIISLGRYLKSEVVKEYINKNFATCKNYILLSKKSTQI